MFIHCFRSKFQQCFVYIVFNCIKFVYNSLACLIVKNISDYCSLFFVCHNELMIILCVGVWKCQIFFTISVERKKMTKRKNEQLILFHIFCISIKFIEIESNLSGVRYVAHINFVNFLEVLHLTLSNIRR